MAIKLNEKLTLLKDSEEGKPFVFADGEETGNGKDFILFLGSPRPDVLQQSLQWVGGRDQVTSFDCSPAHPPTLLILC